MYINVTVNFYYTGHKTIGSEDRRCRRRRDITIAESADRKEHIVETLY